MKKSLMSTTTLLSSSSLSSSNSSSSSSSSTPTTVSNTTSSTRSSSPPLLLLLSSLSAARRRISTTNSSLLFRSSSSIAAALGSRQQQHHYYKQHQQQYIRFHHPDPFDPKTTKGWKAALKESEIPTTAHKLDIERGLALGLPGASSIDDKTIPTFSRGELPHFAGINTFLKAPYIEDASTVGDYDVTVLGVPYDGGCTYRPGTRFGPQGIRRISALYTPYNYERGIDLREQMTLCDVGDVFTIPANIEKTFDQISNAVAHVTSTGSMPIIMGGDHSIGYPTIRGIASMTSKNIGIIHIDRHADIQEKDLDERMHTTPYYHATNIPNVKPKNLVQIGIGGWQVPRPAVPIMIERETNIFTMDDIEQYGIDKIVEMALERAWDGCDAVYLSYDIDSIEAAFVPGTGWPEPGGLLPREALKLVGLVAAEGLCGMEIVEVSPPYDHADITSLMALRLIVDVLGSMVSHNVLGKHKHIIDKEFVPF